MDSRECRALRQTGGGRPARQWTGAGGAVQARVFGVVGGSRGQEDPGTRSPAN